MKVQLSTEQSWIQSARFSFIRTVKLEEKIKVVEDKALLKRANSNAFIHPLTIERSLIFLVLSKIPLQYFPSRDIIFFFLRDSE
jgi:hypothetical protein